MQVTFNLTSAQSAIAKKIATEVAIAYVADEYSSGNMLGDNSHVTMFNHHQNLDFSGKNKQITFEGERSPLAQDGGLVVLSKVAGYTSKEEALQDHFRRLSVASYQTSDKRLKWFETLSSYMDTRASVPELLAYVTEHTTYDRLAFVLQKTNLVAVFKTLRAGNTARASAQVDGPTFTALMRLVNMSKDMDLVIDRMVA